MFNKRKQIVVGDGGDDEFEAAAFRSRVEETFGMILKNKKGEWKGFLGD